MQSDPPQSTALQALLSSWERTGIIVYVGSGILVVCLLTIIMVYTVHRRLVSVSCIIDFLITFIVSGIADWFLSSFV